MNVKVSLIKVISSQHFFISNSFMEPMYLHFLNYHECKSLTYISDIPTFFIYIYIYINPHDNNQLHVARSMRTPSFGKVEFPFKRIVAWGTLTGFCQNDRCLFFLVYLTKDFCKMQRRRTLLYS